MCKAMGYEAIGTGSIGLRDLTWTRVDLRGVVEDSIDVVLIGADVVRVAVVDFAYTVDAGGAEERGKERSLDFGGTVDSQTINCIILSTI